jgi:hypothetical protein
MLWVVVAVLPGIAVQPETESGFPELPDHSMRPNTSPLSASNHNMMCVLDSLPVSRQNSFQETAPSSSPLHLVICHVICMNILLFPPPVQFYLPDGLGCVNRPRLEGTTLEVTSNGINKIKVRFRWHTGSHIEGLLQCRQPLSQARVTPLLGIP